MENETAKRTIDIIDSALKKGVEKAREDKNSEAEQIFSLGIDNCNDLKKIGDEVPNHSLQQDLRILSWKTYFNRAVVRAKMGNLGGAVSDLGEAIKYRDDLPDAYLVRGGLNARRGLYHEALEDFQSARSRSEPHKLGVIEEHIKLIKERIVESAEQETEYYIKLIEPIKNKPIEQRTREDYLVAAEAEFHLHCIEGRNAVYTREGLARGIIKAEDLLSGKNG